jgi:hypothetical protein
MTIAVDFDGTIVEHAYPKIGKPIPFALNVLKKLQQEEHHTLVMWTMREGKLLQEAIDYCEKNGLKFYAYNKNYPEEEFLAGDSRKIGADIYIDDRNIGGLPDWGVIYKIIKSGMNTMPDYDFIPDYDKPKIKKNLFNQIGDALDRYRGYRY